MKKIKLLEQIGITPAGAFIKVKCSEKLNKEDRVNIPEKYIGLLKNEKSLKGIAADLSNDRKYIFKHESNGYNICYPEIHSGNKATRINKIKSKV